MRLSELMQSSFENFKFSIDSAGLKIFTGKFKRVKQGRNAPKWCTIAIADPLLIGFLEKYWNYFSEEEKKELNGRIPRYLVKKKGIIKSSLKPLGK